MHMKDIIHRFSMKLNEEVDDNLRCMYELEPRLLPHQRRDSSTSLTVIKHTLHCLRCSCVLNLKEFVFRVRVSEVHNK